MQTVIRLVVGGPAAQRHWIDPAIACMIRADASRRAIALAPLRIGRKHPAVLTQQDVQIGDLESARAMDAR